MWRIGQRAKRSACRRLPSALSPRLAATPRLVRGQRCSCPRLCPAPRYPVNSDLRTTANPPIRETNGRHRPPRSAALRARYRNRRRSPSASTDEQQQRRDTERTGTDRGDRHQNTENRTGRHGQQPRLSLFDCQQPSASEREKLLSLMPDDSWRWVPRAPTRLTVVMIAHADIFS